MNRQVLGVVAHVDSGKTTLLEAMLYKTGRIKKLGRVDHQDAYLDTDDRERERGITIFSKQAECVIGENEVTLLDTPGHIDFSAEMERVLSILDYAVLVVNGMEGVQSHTETLWSLLQDYNVPVFLFVNKMDMSGLTREELMKDIRKRLSGGCIDFSEEDSDRDEEIAMTDEDVLNTYLDVGTVEDDVIRKLIADRKVFPCCFGSALKVTGVDYLIELLDRYMLPEEYPEEFGARVYKITRDEKGNRLTHMKITGGSLAIRDTLYPDSDEKVNQIRIYSGEKFRTVEQADAGMVCAVTGFAGTYAGEGLGHEPGHEDKKLVPVLSYKMIYPEDTDPYALLDNIRKLEEEDPTLAVLWNEAGKEIHIKVMGDIQLEVLKDIIKKRYGIYVSFGQGRITYKETIAAPVMGVGHFEPLRHYAEAHILMEPIPGMENEFDSVCSEDVLDKNWQRLILTHLKERKYRGVLTGSEVTGIRFTLTAGRAHNKHTEGGDFRQAVYRAVRQGLMMADSILLEPYYDFKLEVPDAQIGRAMADITRMSGEFCQPEMVRDGVSLITGKCPVETMREYHKDVIAYTHGLGRLSVSLGGYMPCHNQDEVVAKIGYDPELDTRDPSSSVFCAHGSGYIVPWQQVYENMHVKEDKGFVLVGLSEYDESGEDIFNNPEALKNPEKYIPEAKRKSYDATITEDEIMEIFARSYQTTDIRTGAKVRNRTDSGYDWHSRLTEESGGQETGTAENEGGDKAFAGKKNGSAGRRPADTGIGKSGAFKKNTDGKEYLLVDGYNIIFAWDELKELSKINLDAARSSLMDTLCNYQGYKGCELILVFDAYKVKGQQREVSMYHNIHVVYTKEAETADMYIEKTTHRLGRKNKVTVATSDGLEQLIIMGQGALRMSARGLKEEIERAQKEIREGWITE